MEEKTNYLLHQLREKTGASLMKCKEALRQSDGNFEEALKWLRKINTRCLIDYER